MQKAKAVIENFLAQLHIYDYYAFIWIALVFILLLIISVVIVRTSTKRAIFIMLIAFIILLAGPLLSFYLVHNFVYKTEVQIDMVKKLQYSKSLVIKGTLINKGIEDFATCLVKVDVFKINQNFLKDFISKIKPMKHKSILIEKKIAPNEIHIFNFIIEPYTYGGDFNVTLKASCRK